MTMKPTKMRVFFLFFSSLCLLAPFLNQEALPGVTPVVAASTLTAAFGRPPSLVLPTCQRPHVIAHRGACGYLPEHTLQAYRLAIDLGVEYIEPDLVLTKDGHLICRHDVDLSETTDVSTRPEFQSRRRNITFASGVDFYPDTQTPKPVQVQGFFSFDFTLAEIKTLRAKQRLTQRSATYNGLFQVPTFEEVIDMVREAEKETGRKVGIYAELKEPYFFKMQGLDIEQRVVEVLEAKALLAEPVPLPGPDVPAPLVVQCFDKETLRRLAVRIPHVPLVQLLLSPTSKEHPSVGEGVSHHLGREAVYGQDTLEEIAKYASGIGPAKTVFTSMDPGAARAVVDRAHELDLAVHPWTFRREAMYVDHSFQKDSDQELRFFYECLNVDALFVEFPDQASMVIQRMLNDDSTEGSILTVTNASGEVVPAPRRARGRPVAAVAAVGVMGVVEVKVDGKTEVEVQAQRQTHTQREKQNMSSVMASSSSSSSQTSVAATTATTTAAVSADAAGGAGAGAPITTLTHTHTTTTTPTITSTASSVARLFMDSLWGPSEQGTHTHTGNGDEDEETCLQMRHARSCSIDGVGVSVGGSGGSGEAAFRTPFYVVPWFRRKAF